MRLTFKQIKSLHVETESGVLLGHVHDIVFEVEGQLVAQYIVRPSMLSSKEFFVSRDQIVRFEEKKMIVDDNLVDVCEIEKLAEMGGMEASPVAMMES